MSKHEEWSSPEAQSSNSHAEKAKSEGSVDCFEDLDSVFLLNDVLGLHVTRTNEPSQGHDGANQGGHAQIGAHEGHGHEHHGGSHGSEDRKTSGVVDSHEELVHSDIF